jgi:hypothetical protein
MSASRSRNQKIGERLIERVKVIIKELGYPDVAASRKGDTKGRGKLSEGGWRFSGDTDARKYDPTLTADRKGIIGRAPCDTFVARSWLKMLLHDRQIIF